MDEIDEDGSVLYRSTLNDEENKQTMQSLATQPSLHRNGSAWRDLEETEQG